MAEANDLPDTEEEEPKKKSRTLFYIIAGVILLLLSGVGFFAYTAFLEPSEQEESDDRLVGEIFALEPFVVNLADPAGKRYLKVQIVLEVEDQRGLEYAERATPKLRDNVINMLTSLSFEEVMTPEGKIRIRDELLERFNVSLRPHRVRNIYFTEFVVQ